MNARSERQAGSDEAATPTPRYVVVEGPIGVGKTTVARRLAERLGSELLLEDAEANPFLPRFYADPNSSALATQLFFLFQRVQQLGSLHQGDLFQSSYVADWMLAKDRLFAELTLTAPEFALYDQIHQHMAPSPPQPDLVIYLQAPADILRRRIAERGVAWESPVRVAYLERLADAYVRFFHDYDAAPLLIVNAEEANFARSDQDFEMLATEAARITGGRHYFNVSPL